MNIVNAKNILLNVVKFVIAPFFAICLILYWLYLIPLKRINRNKNHKPRLLWGPRSTPNLYYWSRAMKKIGHDSVSLVKYIQAYQTRENYDLITSELKIVGIKFIDSKLLHFFESYIAFTYAVKNFDIIHHNFIGGYLATTILRSKESFLYKLFQCKSVLMPTGGDFYRYSKMYDLSWKTGYMMSYPEKFTNEKETERAVNYWQKNADTIIVGFLIDYIGRWDVMPFSFICIDTDIIHSKKKHSLSRGKDSEIVITHSPNHRQLKGTDCIIHAVQLLKNEGYNIKFILMENMQNSEVLRTLSAEADIHVETLLMGYGLSGIEGMASGLPVLTNLSYEQVTQPFRRFSFLNECPAVSTNHENLYDNLKCLIDNPDLRKTLGEAGIDYVEKYHSEKTAQFIFGNIYDKIWHAKDVDLMSLFLPLDKASYNNQTPQIKHPLVENKLPNELF